MSESITPTVPACDITRISLRQTTRSWRSDTFSALRHRNYRLYFAGQFVSVTGSWAQNAALTWLAYEITHESLWPSLVGAMQVLPTFLLGVWGGSLADRLPKRALIFVSQSSLLLLAVLLGCLVLLGQITAWHLLAVAAAAGIANALDLPARLAFVIDLVGRDDLSNAIALNSLQFNLARAVGPALSAVVFAQLAVGQAGQTAAGVCFLLNGFSFVAVLAALAWMDLPSPSPPTPLPLSTGGEGSHLLPSPPVLRGRGVGGEGDDSLWEGFRYLGRHPQLILLLLLSAAIAFFGWPILSLLPAVADHRLGLGTSGYAWMLSAIGGGALIASLLVASFGSRLPRRWFLAAGVVLAASALCCLSAVRSLPLGVACCTVLGCGLILFFPTSQAIMQLNSADRVRGRIMGIWSMVLCGAHPMGHLLAGRAADRFGVPLVLTVMGAGIAAAASIVLALALTWRARRREGKMELK